MDLKKQILLEHSKANTKRITDYIGADEALFAELIKLFLHGSYRVTQRSAWVARQCVHRHPWLIAPFLEKIIDNLDKPVHNAVKRNTVGILEEIEIPDHLMGKVADHCFGFLASAKTPVAIKAFSMSVLLKIVQCYPELKQELKQLIEDQMPFGSAGFVSSGKRVLKALEKV